MRHVRQIGALAVCATLVVLGAVPMGRAPAMGTLLDPAHGVWALARTGELPNDASALLPGLGSTVEVRYDKVQGNRFRHGTRLLRFRDDKEPAQCTWRELRPPRGKNALTVERLLAGA